MYNRGRPGERTTAGLPEDTGWTTGVTLRVQVRLITCMLPGQRDKANVPAQRGDSAAF
jgi:hypothetical protein